MRSTPGFESDAERWEQRWTPRVPRSDRAAHPAWCSGPGLLPCSRSCTPPRAPVRVSRRARVPPPPLSLCASTGVLPCHRDVTRSRASQLALPPRPPADRKTPPLPNAHRRRLDEARDSCASRRSGSRDRNAGQAPRPADHALGRQVGWRPSGGWGRSRDPKRSQGRRSAHRRAPSGLGPSAAGSVRERSAASAPTTNRPSSHPRGAGRGGTGSRAKPDFPRPRKPRAETAVHVAGRLATDDRRSEEIAKEGGNQTDCVQRRVDG